MLNSRLSADWTSSPNSHLDLEFSKRTAAQCQRSDRPMSSIVGLSKIAFKQQCLCSKLSIVGQCHPCFFVGTTHTNDHFPQVSLQPTMAERYRAFLQGRRDTQLELIFFRTSLRYAKPLESSPCQTDRRNFMSTSRALNFPKLGRYPIPVPRYDLRIYDTA